MTLFRNFSFFIVCNIMIVACEKDKTNQADLRYEELTGTWVLKELANKEHILQTTLPQGYNAYLSFREENCIIVSGPCNVGAGKIVKDGNNIKITTLSLTERACEILEMEEIITSNLSGEYQIENDTLTIISTLDTDLYFIKSDTVLTYPCLD